MIINIKKKMNTTDASNPADISFKTKNNKNKPSFENEVKIKFMNKKNQNVIFTRGEDSLPQFTNFPEGQNEENPLLKLDSCPTKKLNFFNEFNGTSNDANNFNSYLFQK